MSSLKRYDFRMHLGSGDSKLLLFRALIVDEKNYHFINVPNFKVDEASKHIFTSIINGTFEIKVVDTEKLLNDGIVEERTVSTAGDTAIERIQSVIKQKNECLAIPDISLAEVDLEPMISFRFAGHDLNLEYGLSTKSANKVYSVSREMISVLDNDDNNFGEVMEMLPVAASTKIPYICEHIDKDAFSLIEKIIHDINNKCVNLEQFKDNKKSAKIYKSFLKKMSEVPKVSDLNAFEIYLGDQRHEVVELDYLATCTNKLYGDPVSGEATITYTKSQLKSNASIFLVALEKDGIEYSGHIDRYDEYFEKLSKFARKNLGKKVNFAGLKVKERTIDITTLSEYAEPEE